jgi:hypothetical protein
MDEVTDDVNSELARSTELVDILQMWLGANTKVNREAVWTLFEKLVSNIVAHEDVEKFRKLKVINIIVVDINHVRPIQISRIVTVITTVGSVSNQDGSHGVLHRIAVQMGLSSQWGLDDIFRQRF